MRNGIEELQVNFFLAYKECVGVCDLCSQGLFHMCGWMDKKAKDMLDILSG